MTTEKKYLYFASDFHLGAPTQEKSLQREKELLAWLHAIESNAHSIFLLGDVFDFWFEYNSVVPKGYIRLLGKLAQLSDNGVQIHFFKGNHDMWMLDYFKDEFNAQIHSNEFTFSYAGKQFYLHHGDGLGPGDYKYKMLKRIFRNPVCQWMFARLHPNFGIGLASLLSRRSRAKGGKKDLLYHGPEKEWLYQYVKESQEKQHQDYYIFGHRHLPLHLETSNSLYLNLGDWLQHYTFACFDTQELQLMQWKNGQISAYEIT
ncbi:MAG: hypothetical protein RLZZ65_682 [Bacteroidota bacterium]|jgi:UDP-2,3-diacylglucosamine hydrolase